MAADTASVIDLTSRTLTVNGQNTASNAFKGTLNISPGATFVVGDANPDDLITFVAEQLSVHKRPREVRLVESLPRNAMGKVVKSELVP